MQGCAHFDDAPIRARALTGAIVLLWLAGCATQIPAGPVADRLDRSQQRVLQGAESAARRLDRRFARDGETPLPATASSLRVGIDTAAFDRGGSLTGDAALDLDVTLALPNIERRLRLFVTTDELTESPTVSAAEERRLRIGARVAFLRDVDFDIGVRADLWPTAFAAVKWSQYHTLGRWRLAPFLKTYVESDDGFGVASGFTLDHVAGPWLWRSSSYVDWENDRDAAVWTQALVVAHVFDTIVDSRPSSPARLRDIGYGTGVRLAISSPEAQSSSVGLYSATLFVKRPLYGSWLYWNFGPEIRWERDRDWRADLGFRLGLDILFREPEQTR